MIFLALPMGGKTQKDSVRIISKHWYEEVIIDKIFFFYIQSSRDYIHLCVLRFILFLILEKITAKILEIWKAEKNQSGKKERKIEEKKKKHRMGWEKKESKNENRKKSA